LAFSLAPLAQAQPWVSMESHTRYMAIGDSISAGYGAMPATQGFVYQLYQGGAIDKVNETLFCAAGVPGALSKDVLDYQVPQVERFFSNTGMPYRKVVTLTLGGNDLLQILGGADPYVVLPSVGNNLAQILARLVSQFPEAQIYVANYYDPRLPVPGGSEQLVALLNGAIGAAVANFSGHAVLVDLHSAFNGRSGLLLIDKKGSGEFEVHPTNAGYRVITQAFEDAITGER
jgi:lysophospholipase L1-like esterase